MGLLQDLPDRHGDPILVTLNPPFEPNPDLTYGRYKYEHPILSEEVTNRSTTFHPPRSPRTTLPLVLFSYSFTQYNFSMQAIRAQSLLPTIQNARGISFAGAWTKYGFHEDGFTSGLRAAAALAEPSAKLPFKIVSADRPPDRAAVRLARWFDLFEGCGAAWILGRVFATILAVLRVALRVDLRNPGPGLRHATGAKEAKEE